MKRQRIQMACQTTFKDDTGRQYLRSKSGTTRNRPVGIILTSLLKKLQYKEKLINLTLTPK